MQTKPIFRYGGSAAVAWTTPWSRKFFLQSCHMLFRYSTAWMESDIHIFYVRNFCHHRCHFSTTSVPHVWFHILTLKSIFMRGTKLKFDSWRWEFGLKMILKAIFVAFWKTSESWYPAAASKVPSMHPVVLEKVPTHPKHPGCSDQSVCPTATASAFNDWPNQLTPRQQAHHWWSWRRALAPSWREKWRYRHAAHILSWDHWQPAQKTGVCSVYHFCIDWKNGEWNLWSNSKRSEWSIKKKADN